MGARLAVTGSFDAKRLKVGIAFGKFKEFLQKFDSKAQVLLLIEDLVCRTPKHPAMKGRSVYSSTFHPVLKKLEGRKRISQRKQVDGNVLREYPLQKFLQFFGSLKR
jgi:hypothetical protein